MQQWSRRKTPRLHTTSIKLRFMLLARKRTRPLLPGATFAAARCCCCRQVTENAVARLSEERQTGVVVHASKVPSYHTSFNCVADLVRGGVEADPAAQVGGNLAQMNRDMASLARPRGWQRGP